MSDHAKSMIMQVLEFGDDIIVILKEKPKWRLITRCNPPYELIWDRTPSEAQTQGAFGGPKLQGRKSKTQSSDVWFSINWIIDALTFGEHMEEVLIHKDYIRRVKVE